MNGGGWTTAVLGCVAFCMMMEPCMANTTRTITVYERSSRTLERIAVTAAEGEVYLPMEFLVERVGLKRKSLPGGNVGICRGDLCVPFSVGEAPGFIRRTAERELVPAGRLAKSMGGAIVWDAEENDLLLDLAGRPASASPANGSSVDFTLPDLAGRPVALSAFRGKKVLVFAWASW